MKANRDGHVVIRIELGRECCGVMCEGLEVHAVVSSFMQVAIGLCSRNKSFFLI
jgi:hypothetical protein